jgi:hypothetical protein
MVIAFGSSRMGRVAIAFWPSLTSTCVAPGEKMIPKRVVRQNNRRGVPNLSVATRRLHDALSRFGGQSDTRAFHRHALYLSVQLIGKR